MVVTFRSPEGKFQPDSGRRNFDAAATSMAGGLVPIGRLACPGGEPQGIAHGETQKLNRLFLIRPDHSIRAPGSLKGPWIEAL